MVKGNNWLNSESHFKRALAIWGYWLEIELLFIIIVFILAFGLGVFLSFFD